jgi:protein-disulfide isomerase
VTKPSRSHDRRTRTARRVTDPGAHVSHVFEDFNSGTRSGVNGAPTFFINGARLDWDFQPGTLGDALQAALSAAIEPVQ